MTLILVMAVPLVIWAGIFLYLLMMDRTLRRLERESAPQDEL